MSADLNKYFDKIYCVNLDRRPDRYKKTQAELRKFGINNVERFSAIDGNTLENNTRLLNGELGILNSHYEIIQQAKNDNLKNVLILEDDVYFTNELNDLDSYMTSVPEDWGFIYFGGNHIYGNPPQKINDKVLKLNFTVALQCVAINSIVFNRILEILPKRAKQVDAYYGDLQKEFNAYGFTPNLALQRTDYSDIQNKVVDYSHFFKNS